MPSIDVNWQVDLPSSGYPCETCGLSWDAVQVEAGVLDDRVEWYATYSFGCHGGYSGNDYMGVLDVIDRAIADHERRGSFRTATELAELRHSVTLFDSIGWQYR